MAQTQNLRAIDKYGQRPWKKLLALFVANVGTSLETLTKRSPHHFFKIHEKLKVKLSRAEIMFGLVTFLVFVFYEGRKLSQTSVPLIHSTLDLDPCINFVADSTRRT